MACVSGKACVILGTNGKGKSYGCRNILDDIFGDEEEYMKNMVEIIPLVGMDFRDKRIQLLDSKEKVKELLGEPYSEWKKSFYYFENELRVDFDENGMVEFIEFLGGIDGKIKPEIYGVSAFETEADVLYGILKERNAGEIDDSENGHSYGFLNISVGVYRERTPECVQDMIEDAAADDDPMDAEDIAYEMRRANHWDTIGIGVQGYYR